jgi:hypothetical protein
MRLLGRRDCPPRRSLGHPAGPQPVADPGRAGTTGAVSAARPRHEVLPRLGRRGPLPGWGRAGGTGPGAQGERVRGALGPHSPYRVPGLAADRRPRPPGPSSGRIIEALCVDATCSVVCSTSTGELHERLRAPFNPPYRARFLRSPDSAATSKLPSADPGNVCPVGPHSRSQLSLGREDGWPSGSRCGRSPMRKVIGCCGSCVAPAGRW